jgi:hypothetical protein
MPMLTWLASSVCQLRLITLISLARGTTAQRLQPFLQQDPRRLALLLEPPPPRLERCLPNLANHQRKREDSSAQEHLIQRIGSKRAQRRAQRVNLRRLPGNLGVILSASALQTRPGTTTKPVKPPKYATEESVIAPAMLPVAPVMRARRVMRIHQG